MSGRRRTSLTSGIFAGVAGGLAASWLMNQFSAGPGKALSKAALTEDQKEQQSQASPESAQQPDATMRAADAITASVTGRHLSEDEQQTGGPIVHYSFGALMGGVYGGLSEYLPATRAGFGTVFASALFTGADLLAVPAFGLSPKTSQQPASTMIAPYASHLVYGISTELVRRAVRALL